MSERHVSQSQERREVLLRDLHITSLMERLPPAVFPVSAAITMRRSTAEDDVYTEFAPPEYPVPVRKPVGAYIPDTTVYFDNPAVVSDERKKTWRYDEFCEQFEAQLEQIDELSSGALDRIYLTELRLVEIPAAYVSSTNGQRSADPSLYQDEATMTIGRFSKYTELAASDVREELGDSLPDDTTKPLRLTQVKEVTAKPYQGTGTGSKRRYYTGGQADSYNSAEKGPRLWAIDEGTSVEQINERLPLRPALDSIETFFPALSESEFFRPVKFYGTTETGTSFVANDLIDL